jgi:hypothetical protein
MGQGPLSAFEAQRILSFATKNIPEPDKASEAQDIHLIVQ